MKNPEGENLEFKAARHDWNSAKLNRYCVALCNEGGGKLILGVNDDNPRKVVGSNAFLNLNNTKSKIFDKLRIRVDAEVVSHSDGRVLENTVDLGMIKLEDPESTSKRCARYVPYWASYLITKPF